MYKELIHTDGEYDGLFNLPLHVNYETQAILVEDTEAEGADKIIGVIVIPKGIKNSAGYLMSTLNDMFTEHYDAEVIWADGDFEYIMKRHCFEGTIESAIRIIEEDEEYNEEDYVENHIRISIIPKY